jgi:hypothetical protein
VSASFPRAGVAWAGARALGVLALALGAAACGDPINLGPDPDFVWWSDHESGDLGDWLRGGPALGSSYTAGGGDISVQSGLARSGQHALRSTAAGAGGPATAQVTRRGLPAAAYYGAWFYLPALAHPTTYWVFFAFHGGDAASGDVALWDLKLTDVDVATAGTMELRLLHHDTGDVAPARHVAVPVGRWFQVQAFFRAATDGSGLLQVRQDGQLVYDVPGATVTAAPGLAWMLGSLTDGLTPASTALFVDDAYVTTRPLAPDSPPFWRGP